MAGIMIWGFSTSAYSFSNFKLDEGTYTFSKTKGNPKTFIVGEFYGDCKVLCKVIGTHTYILRPPLNGNDYTFIDGGSFNVTVSGNSYTITTNFSGNDVRTGKTVNNIRYKYTGTLQKFDSSK
jgi:hypothetical protein